MKAPVSRAAIAALSALALAAGQRAEASIAPRWDDTQLANFAEVILTGRVIDIRAGRDPRVHAIYTYVTLDVGRVLKGAIHERQVVVKQLGGVLPTRGLAISDQATFTVGEDVLLFLAVRPRDRTLYTVALWQGKFTLDNEDRERTALRRDPGTFVETRWRLDIVAAMLARTVPAARDTSAAIETRPVEGDAAVASYTLLGPFRYDFSPVIDVQAKGYPLLTGGGIPEIVAAASRWNAVGGSFAFRAGSLEGAARCYLQELFNSRVTISFNDPCGEIGDNSGTVAIGGSYFDTTTGTTINGQYFFRATEGFIVTNDDTLTANLLRWPGCFYDVHLHELGHVLGLGHSIDANAIMHPVVRSSCMIAPHDLGVDDLEGFRFIYPPVVTAPTAAPGNVQVIVNGRESVTVSYTAVTADVAAGASAATSYRIEFRRGPRRPPFGWVTSFGTSAVVAVPPELSGTFYVTVVAVNSAGEGPGSSPVQFFVPCSPPAMPAGLSGSVVGGVVTVSWTAAAGATGYVLQTGSDTSAANLFNGNVGNVTTVTAAGWPPDLHAFVRVIAVNQCGPGPPTAPVLIQ